MSELFKLHKTFWSQKSFRWSVFFGLFLLFTSFISNYYANIYVTQHASNTVSDIVLDNVPVINVGFLFIEGSLIFWLIIGFFLAKKPDRIPFVFKSVALFVFIRSISMSLTHIAAPPIHSFVDPYKWFLNISSGNDLFFSSHTGLPFLMALIFWNNYRLRIFCLASSATFAVIVLLGHLHYSIDVFAAYFMTFTIFHIAQKIFAKDFNINLN